MNRKDTILVAVLINAGVLVVLFTSALKNKQLQHNLNNEPQSSLVFDQKTEPVGIMKDEIDLVIEQAKKQEVAAESMQVPNSIAKTSDVAQIEQPIATVDTFIDVTVKQGDFLAKIAKRHNVTVEDIMKANVLKNTNLRIGQVLKIPQSVKLAAVEPAAKVETSSLKKYYVIKPGDSPWTIAHKHKMKVEELLKMNSLTSEKAKHLKVGDKILVK